MFYYALTLKGTFSFVLVCTSVRLSENILKNRKEMASVSQGHISSHFLALPHEYKNVCLVMVFVFNILSKCT